MIRLPRDRFGRFISLKCPDLNCNGKLVHEFDCSWGTAMWHCDGLTHNDKPESLLYACPVIHMDGWPKEGPIELGRY